jgi:carbamoyltransferase
VSYILGINISHNPSSCLLKDGKVILYKEETEETLGYKTFFQYGKYDPVYCSIVEDILKLTDTIDHLVFTSTRREQDLFDNLVISRFLDLLIKKHKLKAPNVYYFPENHHIYHGLKAYKDSGFDEAVVMVMDGHGTYLTHQPSYREIDSIYKFTPVASSTIFKHYSSAGNYHTTKNEIPNLPILSFQNKYKTHYIMSDRVSSGYYFCDTSMNMFKADPAVDTCMSKELMELSLKYKENITETKNVKYLDGFAYIDLSLGEILASSLSDLSTLEQAKYAKQIQVDTKVYATTNFKKAVELSGCNNVVLSGGFFMNKINNRAYIKENPGINFYIDSVPHDGGTAIGAAYYIDAILNNYYFSPQK